MLSEISQGVDHWAKLRRGAGGHYRPSMYKLNNMLLRLFLLLFGVLTVHIDVDAVRVKDNIRVELTNVKNNCMRLLNGTHEMGCQSDQNGNSGVVLLVNNRVDLESQLKNLPWGLTDVIALVNVKNLNRDVLSVISENSQVVGILLFRNESQQFDGFSEDSFCPNRVHSMYSTDSKCDWNKNAALHPNGFFALDYEKPVFVITNQTEISLLVDNCYYAFNNPTVTANYRCVAKMKSFMLAAGDASLCIGRRTHTSLTVQNPGLCDEVFDYNVISVLPALPFDSPKANAIVLGTRMDSFSLFSASRGGDVSVLVSLITSLSVARSVGLKRSAFETATQQSGRRAIFANFHVESLGYSGSTRFVYDLQQPPPEKPAYKPDRTAKHLQLDDIGAFVELQQLSFDHDTLYLHGDAQTAKQFPNELAALANSAKAGAAGKVNVNALYSQPNARLPPASYQSFLKHKQIPGFLVAPFRDEYKSRTVNSFFDTRLSESPMLREKVLSEVDAAGNVALKVLLDYVGANQSDFAFDREFAGKLVDCFLYDTQWNCSFFAELLKNQPFNVFPHMTYIEYGGHSSLRKIVNALMVYSLGDSRPATNVKSESECASKNKHQNLYNYVWQNDPDAKDFHCYRTSIYKYSTRSPAFFTEDYDLRNATYPSWMESRWDATHLEIYLGAGRRFELHAVAMAMMCVAVGGLLFYFLDESWFVDETDVIPAHV